MTICDKCDGNGSISFAPWPHLYTCKRCHGTGQKVTGISYAGVGSAVTPLAMIREIETIAMQLAIRGWVLRSGHHPRTVPVVADTDSADKAFERGCESVAGRKIIRVGPHKADRVVMGDYGDDPARFVVCYATDGQAVEPIAAAMAAGVPVFNLAVQPVSALWSWLDGAA